MVGTNTALQSLVHELSKIRKGRAPSVITPQAEIGGPETYDDMVQEYAPKKVDKELTPKEKENQLNDFLIDFGLNLMEQGGTAGGNEFKSVLGMAGTAGKQAFKNMSDKDRQRYEDMMRQNELEAAARQAASGQASDLRKQRTEDQRYNNQQDIDLLTAQAELTAKGDELGFKQSKEAREAETDAAYRELLGAKADESRAMAEYNRSGRGGSGKGGGAGSADQQMINTLTEQLGGDEQARALATDMVVNKPPNYMKAYMDAYNMISNSPEGMMLEAERKHELAKMMTDDIIASMPESKFMQEYQSRQPKDQNQHVMDAQSMLQDVINQRFSTP